MSKDICGYFHSFSKHSASSIAASNKDISNSDSEDSDKEPVTKKPCHSLSSWSVKKWETDFEWLVYDEDLQGAFCKHCQKWAKASNKSGLLNHFIIGSKNGESESHRNAWDL